MPKAPVKKKTPSAKTKKSENLIPSLQESVISRVNADNTVAIVNLELDDVCYTLDGIAAEIWTLIDGKKPVNEIKKEILEKHRPPTQIFETDFSKFVKKLEKENLIVFQS